MAIKGGKKIGGKKKRLPRVLPSVTRDKIHYEYCVVTPFESYAKGDVVDPGDIARITRNGNIRHTNKVLAGVLSTNGHLSTSRASFDPSAHQGIKSPYKMTEVERALWSDTIDINRWDGKFTAFDPLTRSDIEQLFRDYQTTFNPLFLMDIIRRWPETSPFPWPIQRYIQNAFNGIVRGAWAMALSDKDAPSVNDAVRDVAAHLGLVGPSVAENMFDAFAQYCRDIIITEEINELVKAGKTLQQAKGEVGQKHNESDKTLDLRRRRAKFVIRDSSNDTR